MKIEVKRHPGAQPDTDIRRVEKTGQNSVTFETGISDVTIREAYIGPILISDDGERLGVFMRDSGFELSYEAPGFPTVNIALKCGVATQRTLPKSSGTLANFMVSGITTADPHAMDQIAREVVGQVLVIDLDDQTQSGQVRGVRADGETIFVTIEFDLIGITEAALLPPAIPFKDLIAAVR